MADRLRRLIIGIVTTASMVVASLIAPSFVHAKVAPTHAVSASHADSTGAMPCHHVQKPKPQCPGNDCQGSLGCLAKCALAVAMVASGTMPSFEVWANLAEPVPTTPMGDRFIPPLLRPPIV